MSRSPLAWPVKLPTTTPLASYPDGKGVAAAGGEAARAVVELDLQGR